MFGINTLTRTLRNKAPATPPSAARPAAVVNEGDDDALRCSWFESSLDLREGLEVTEFDSLTPVANDLPLAWWLH